MVGTRALPSLLLLLAPLSLGLPACADQPDGDGPPVVTSGHYYGYIQHGWNFPATSAEWRELGFDLDHDGVRENQVGSLIGSLGQIGLAIGDANADMVTSGDVILGHVVRADRLDRDGSVAWQLWSSAGPPPRYDSHDVIAPSSVDGELVGMIVADTLHAEWGTAAIRVPLFPGQPPVILPLAEAHLDLATRGTCHGVIGGVLDDAGLATALDQVATEAIAHIAAHPDNDFSHAAYAVFDTAPHDGTISKAEITAFAAQLLRPDVDLDGDGGKDGVSAAFGFDCAPAELAIAPSF